MENQLHQLHDKIQLLSFWWLKAKNVAFDFDYHTWWHYTLLNIGLTM